MPKKTTAAGQAFKRRLRQALQSMGWTGNRLATTTGIPQATISRWLSGQRGQYVDPQMMWTVAQTLGCDFAWLVTGNGQPPDGSRDSSSSKAVPAA